MHRIDNATAATSLPAPAAVGPKPNAFFTKGNPGGGTPATIVDDDWANAIQEELADVIESAGITLSKTDRTQLKQAIRIMTAGIDAVARFTTTANINLTGLGTQAGGDWGGTLTAGDVIFVQSQTTGSQNGWYTAASGAWPRVKWLDESVEVKPSMLTKVSEGTTLADTIFMLTTDGPITLGTTALVFARKDTGVFASNAEAQAFAVSNKSISPATLAAAFKGANQSLGAAPYQILPGGYILQMGKVSFADIGGSANVTVTFPFTFPNGIFLIAATAGGTAGFNVVAMVNESTVTNSGFTGVVTEITAVTQSGGQYRYLAIGY